MSDKLDLILTEMSFIKGKVTSIEEAQAHNSIRTKRIEDKLLGDKEYRTKGFIEDFTDTQKEVIMLREKIEEKELSEKVALAKQRGMAIGLGATAGGGIVGIWETIKHFFGGH
jgi:hypothetical protein